MPSIHPIHRPGAAYGQPEVHIPYPAEHVNYPPYLSNADDDPDHESLTGETKGDETTTEEWLIPDAVFSNSVLDKIGIGPSRTVARTPNEMTPEVERTDVLLPIPRSAAEEKELHESVMTSLRKRVAALEEEELFESSMKRFTRRSSFGGGGGGGGGGVDITHAVGAAFALGHPISVVGEPNAAGMGEQPRSRDARELLKADIRETWAKERERTSREA